MSQRLPERYRLQWRTPFDRHAARYLQPGICILDVGGGAAPTIAPEKRPAGATYVGLDVSRGELEQAPAGSYDEIYEADAAGGLPLELHGRFDLILSWQVFEHVSSLERAADNCRQLLGDNGALVAQFSGTFTLFGLLNRLVPHRLAVELLYRLNDRPRESIFPAYYDRCWYTAIQKALQDWQRLEIQPLYHGAEYLRFNALLQRSYLTYENWACRAKKVNLATHYLVAAER